MPTASFAPPALHLPDLPGLAVLRRRAVVLGRLLAFTASCAGMAGFLWLVLAGPGFGTDRASTAQAGHASRIRMVAQR
ncbi:MAG: hypothetical protein ACRYGM_19585 [Janthinobacterium lividum]